MKYMQNRYGLIICAIVFMALEHSTVLAQQINPTILNRAALEIRAMNKQVDDSLLTRDQAIIKSAFPTIKGYFADRGYSTADVNAAVVSSWKDFRIQEASLTPFDVAGFASHVLTLGRLRIESEPPQAAIVINTTRQQEKTNAIKWLTPGTYRIVLNLDGYLPEEEERNVIEGDNPPLHKALKMRQK